MDIEIRDADPKNPEVGIIRSQRVVPHKGIIVNRDDLLRAPDEASQETLDDLHERL